MHRSAGRSLVFAGAFLSLLLFCCPLLAVLPAADAPDRTAGPTDSSYFLSIGRKHESSKEYEKALSAFEKAVALDQGNYSAWSAIGRVCSALKQYRKAVEAFQEAVRLRPGYYVAHAQLGWAFSHLRLFDQAVAAFEKAMKLEPRDPLNYIDLGLTYNELNRFDHAASVFERGLALSPGNVQLFQGLVLAHFLAGKYEKTIDLCRRELTRRPECPECLLWIGTSYGYLGDYENGVRAYQAAIALCRQNGDEVCEADVLLKMGGFNLLSRQDVFAEINLERALAVFQERGMKLQEALVLRKIGSLKAAFGDYDTALDCYKKALPLAEGTNRPDLVLDVYTGLMTFSPDPHEKLSYARLARDFAYRHNLLKLGDVFRSWEIILGVPDLKSVDDATKRIFADRLRAWSEEPHDAFGRVEVSLTLGIALAMSGQDESARTSLESAYRAASLVNDRGSKAGALRWLALIAFRNGDLGTAIERYRAAVGDIEGMRGSSQSLNAKMSVVQRAQEIYAETIMTLKLLGDGETAFSYAERARGNDFVATTGGNRGTAAKDLDIVKHERFLRLRAFSIEQEMDELKATAAKSEAKHGALEAELRRAREEHAGLLEKMERENPELFSFFATSAITVKEVQGILDADTTLLEYFIAGHRVFLWVISKSGFQLIDLPTSAADLGVKVKAYREQLKGLRPDYEQSARELFDLLVRPAKPFIRTGTIGIVPHATLHYLPFQALLDVEQKGGTTEKRFLIEEYDIFYAPSASALKYTYQKRKSLNGRILAFGNPDLGDRGMDLPHAERELAEIKKAFPGAEIYLRKEATKARATGVSPGFSVLHFASHAELDGKNPLSSSIRLAGSGGDNGRLTVNEIFGLDLKNTSLVTLSACETGLGELRGGDELIGLTRAFIYAGAPSIVASLWPVNDESTSRLMALFYSNLRTFTKAEALRRAQIEMIRGETGKGIVRGVGGITTQSKTSGSSQKSAPTVNGSHPFFWAPFILLGDWK